MRRCLTLFALLLLVPAVAGAQTVGLAGGYVFSSGPNPAKVGGVWVFDGTIDIRNGTNAQTLNVYNTYTDASNYERGGLKYGSGTLTIFTEAAGTGSTRPIYLDASNNLVYSDTFAPIASDGLSLGQNGNFWQMAYLTRGIQGSKSKSLTDAGAAVSIERVAVPTNGYIGVATMFTANSTDGTNRLTTSGIVTWAAADTGGTVTCGTPVVTGLVTAYKRANTLVCTFTTGISTTNCDLLVTCTDNLAGVQTMAIEHFPIMPSPNTYTPQ